MDFAVNFAQTLWSTSLDVLPIVVILVVFQVAVLRRSLPNLRRIVGGFVCVLLGLALFLIGLQDALFPIGETMARQLTAPEAIGVAGAEETAWTDYWLVYAFAAAIGFATAIAEPSLIAVALKAEEVSGNAINAWGLRLAVATGAATGVALGCFPDRDRDAAAVVHRGDLHRGDHPDLPIRSQHRAARLRQRRG